MTEITNIRCDGCGALVRENRSDPTPEEKEWAYCRVWTGRFDYCPECWQAIQDFIRDRQQEVTDAKLSTRQN